jgi:predicted CXXCH cytochrome family protein
MNNIEPKKRSFIGPIALCTILFVAFLLGSSGKAQSGLRAKVPDLCYRCHAELKKGLSDSSVHIPFKQGQCISCHDAHVSGMKALMREEINPLCLSCHNDLKNLLEKASVHGALRDGVCTDCHKAHSAKNKKLLVSSQKELCWTCHETLKEEFKRPYAHIPFTKGECSSCHNAHAATERYQLVAAPNDICQDCHQPGCKAGGVSIAAITKKMDCVKCHTGHSSDAQGLLGPLGHAAFLDKSCGNCHNPITAGRAITTRLEGSALCFQCHEKKPENFREGDVHGKDMKNPCTLCHEYHAAKNVNLTVREYEVCLTCHAATDKRISFMVRALKRIRCTPVKDRKCFECHKPFHSKQPYYLVADASITCTMCHEAQHKATHPLGEGVVDPRDGTSVTCTTCHSMHDARAIYMLKFDRKRALCIQCHKR